MKRDLNRRLRAAEMRWFVSERVAGILRAINAMSDQEPGKQIEPSGIFDPHTLTDAELDALIAEFERRIADAARNH